MRIFFLLLLDILHSNHQLFLLIPFNEDFIQQKISNRLLKQTLKETDTQFVNILLVFQQDPRKNLLVQFNPLLIHHTLLTDGRNDVAPNDILQVCGSDRLYNGHYPCRRHTGRILQTQRSMKKREKKDFDHVQTIVGAYRRTD